MECKISYDDGMYSGNGDHYFSVGLSAIHCIDEALAQAGLDSIGTILDLPCGYGRVMWFLAHRFPAAKITACELAEQAVEFCAGTFGATAAYSNLSFRGLSFDTQFDLIWCGSLVTDLDKAGIVALLSLFKDSSHYWLISRKWLPVHGLSGPACLRCGARLKRLRRFLDVAGVDPNTNCTRGWPEGGLLSTAWLG